MRFRVEPMGMEHIAAVSVIERRCFSQPWPPNAYRKEIQTNRMAHYFVARHADGEDEPVPAPASMPPNLNGGNGILGKLSRLFRGPRETSTIQVYGTQPTTIVGYAGLWLMTDEAHVTTIAVDPEFQGHGIGELLLLGLIDRAKQIGARWLTLEVRVTNAVAQTLYQKYTFKEMGVRRRYYSDNGEDALVMWTDPIESETFQNALCRNREALGRKLAAHE